MKDKLTQISDDFNHDVITKKEAKEQLLILCGVSGSAYKDALIKKAENMIWFARENYNEKYYEGVLNAMRNMQVHINKLHKKHYR